MKFPLAIFLLTLTATAPAGASSFVMLKRAETQPSPSIILFVEPDRQAPGDTPELLGAAPPVAADSVVPIPSAERFVRVSDSIIAMGEPAVEATIVASITPDDKPMRNPHLPPMVIRGGLFGDALPRGTGLANAPVEPAEGETAQAPAGGGTPKPGEQRPPEPPRAPPPQQPQGPTAPTRLPE